MNDRQSWRRSQMEEQDRRSLMANPPKREPVPEPVFAPAKPMPNRPHEIRPDIPAIAHVGQRVRRYPDNAATRRKARRK